VTELSGEDSLNTGIGVLVGCGMPPSIQRAMDAMRVIGNNAVQPGEIQVDDDPAMVASLFALLNVIVENQVAQPAEIDAMYEALPLDALEAIDKRDGGTR
jgi:hypothetical protein